MYAEKIAKLASTAGVAQIDRLKVPLDEHHHDDYKYGESNT